MPKSLVKDEKTATPTYAKFVAEPFEAGYGHTVGNSLRRVLLSSLEGAAITSVKIEGAPHEFTTIPGVGDSRTFQATGSYFRVVVTNVTGTVTTYLRLQTAMCPIVEALP